jgi:carotenoid 1,2-hydratase
MDEQLSAAHRGQPASGALSGGGQRASGRGGADGGAFGADGRGAASWGFGFDRQIVPDGYCWWYVDALSDDGQHGLTLIGFIGSVFSPYYFGARKRGPADAHEHCALNVALYGKGGKRWALTERASGAVRQSRSAITIGPSAISWDGTALVIDIEEITVPIPSRLRGQVRVHPAALTDQSFFLDSDNLHRWTPAAPISRVEVSMSKPGLRWSGQGYFDMNQGEVPLERSFVRWDWSRAVTDDGVAILYDISRRDGSQHVIAQLADGSGTLRPFDAPPPAKLPRGRIWRMAQGTRADAGSSPKITETLEDSPFYTRSVLSTQMLGQPARGVHESLSLDRFSAPWVQVLVPFRMPRVRG